MEIFLAILMLILGLVLIIKGGDWFVDSSIWIARVASIPEIIIGARSEERRVGKECRL